MERSLEQRYAIKFYVRLGKNATETFQMLQKAFKDDCISRSQSGKWHKAFKEGREEVADEPRSGRPTTARTDENVDRVLEVLRTDRRLSIQQIAATLHMSTFVVHGIVTEDLQMRKVCAKLVPIVLTKDQKELRVLRCQELLDLIQNEPDFLNSVVTGDESWMFEYDPESKRQSCAWHTKSSPRPKKARMSKSRIKTLIIVFFDIRGIVHCEFVPQGQFLFPRLKREMKGKHWETVENIQHHVTTFLRSIPVEEFQGAFQAWQTRLRKCIDAGGIFFGHIARHKRMEYTILTGKMSGRHIPGRPSIRFVDQLKELTGGQRDGWVPTSVQQVSSGTSWFGVVGLWLGTARTVRESEVKSGTGISFWDRLCCPGSRGLVSGAVYGMAVDDSSVVGVRPR
ncbi:hypothetical protein LAZ67_1005052 [Cordylochernes scorpioides]|uniref:Mos1 transposase HTH domain-containing protein n=1 Tax=Cordylochernes scorpioides TaxID=51811 RepID=A0ABY6JYQ5_9ARAC|nr:hypothetical protein LAZ67_1005052 [Cordylochernes scorpioides]